jgi:hypothetical protein
MATLDPSIYMTARPKSAFEYLQEMAAADDAKQTRQLRGLQLLAQQGQMQDAQQSRDIRNRGLSAVQALGGGASDDQRIGALRGVGDYGTADSLEKSLLERQKTAATVAGQKESTEKDRIANFHAKTDRHLQNLTMVNTPQDAMSWLKQGLNDGIMDMQKVSAFAAQVKTMTPEQFAQWKEKAAAAGMSLKEQAEQIWKQKGYDLQVQESGERARHNRAQEGLTARGQNMTDARSRDLNEIARANRADDKRIANVDKGVTDLSKTLQKEGIPELETAISGAEGALGRYKNGEVPGIGPLKNMLPAAMMSDEGKDVRQALAQVRNIVLSARSGAAVTDQELRRLVEEIGTGAGMSEDDIRKGLAKVRTRINAIKTNAAAGVSDDVLREYQGRGGLPISRGDSQSKPKQVMRFDANGNLVQQ